ncbi:Ivy family c-type lysozyme inhibitor [Bosea sp. (in: a-proteobacteria)]|uniref:Ivy family c-type lysozyme inhibitor n=1 Tax=Bosea sp. (in: a-proteobacteria) TaxID=1871050 RepID=UPI0027365CE1|nr:Ivy family c-type lysozyme inhibitor [Bosea sp. (in: a-proteobacteria)]MDP3406784.1 Ivy family c-type lysozyme inhibitor [Bosea sp. (in: a-proteobacteria)]
MQWGRCVAISVLLWLYGLTSASAQLHPQELLATPWIKAAWTRALAGERFERWDSWIAPFAGVGSAPESRQDASGKSWTVVNLCQPRNCADNKLVVLIDPSNRTIHALQTTVDPSRERFFNRPDAGMQGMLRAARAGDLARASIPGSAPTAATAADPAPSPRVAGAAGTIEGELSYPSDYIPPDMQICAEDIATKQLTCSSRKTRAGKQMRYSMSLPPGEYFVFAQTKDSPGQRAYYSEFVVCGLNAACKSHKPIAVAVAPGVARKQIDPQDWYAP